MIILLHILFAILFTFLLAILLPTELFIVTAIRITTTVRILLQVIGLFMI